MAEIAISMFPEEGHLIPSFKLARLLQAEGHNITYVGLPDYESYIRAQGFAFAPLLAEGFPPGWRQRQVERLASTKGLAYLKEISQSAFYRALCQLAAQDSSEIHTTLAALRPDIWIIDGFLAPLTLRVRSCGVPVAILSININLARSENYPPVVTNMVPDDTPASRSRTGSAWGISGMIRGITSLLVGFNFSKELKRLATICGSSPDMVIDAALYPKLQPSDELPELIVCAEEFDFPRPDGPGAGVYFIGPSLDLERKSDDFPWERLDPSQQLAFCTLGSQSHLYARGRAFFQAVIDTLGARPGWQLVLATGPHIDPDSFGEVPPNVLLTRWAPHSAMLRRAALMINHGGLGTVKECIYFDVPMLCFPITRDQPGYAARVAYHGLGLMGNIRRADSATLTGMIDTIERDASFRTRVAAMGAIFRQAEDARQGVDVIERQLAQTLVYA